MPKAPAEAGKGVVAGRIAWAAGYFLLRALWVSTMVLTPLFGFWLASSLAAYNNASQWLSLLLGLALFPLLPIGWEVFASWRRTKQKVPTKQILTRLDRLVLRTLVVNGVFLVVMLYFSKATAIRAIAQRGDWMLDGHDGAFANKFRGALLALADKLDRKPVGGDDHDRYGDSDEAPDPNKTKHRDEPVAEVKPGTNTPPPSGMGWPLDEAIDPKVETMPEAAQASIESVGAYLKREFPDKKLRVKAIHDFVALRLHYDDDTLNKIMAGNHDVPSQEAAPVFAARTAVCAGYSKLMVAIGAAAGLEIKYVTGYIRDSSRRVTNPTGSDESIRASLQGVRHAWNAVLIDDEWHLIDSTWNDPTDRSGKKQNKIRTTYLFTPPKLFAYDHIPEDPAWQLVMKPISMGDWARAPMMSPEIGKLGLVLESPTRSQVTVSGEVDIVFDNPYGARIEAGVVPDRGKREGGRITLGDGTCKTAKAPNRRTILTCKVPDGEYAVEMFGQLATEKTKYEHIGTILVNSR